MTTSVKVTAHCPEGIFVEVKLTGKDGEVLDCRHLRDGDIADNIVYDDLTLTVQELPDKTG